MNRDRDAPARTPWVGTARWSTHRLAGVSSIVYAAVCLHTVFVTLPVLPITYTPGIGYGVPSGLTDGVWERGGVGYGVPLRLQCELTSGKAARNGIGRNMECIESISLRVSVVLGRVAQPV